MSQTDSETADQGRTAESAPMDCEIGILARRKIEAAIIAPIYEEMVREVGETRAQAILDMAISKAAIAGREELRGSHGRRHQFENVPGPPGLMDARQCSGDRSSRPRQTNGSIITSRRCRYSETYREMGLGHIGHLLSCNRDGVFCQGYNPAIKMKRTQTLMQGAEYCDFRYTLQAGSQENHRAEDQDDG